MQIFKSLVHIGADGHLRLDIPTQLSELDGQCLVVLDVKPPKKTKKKNMLYRDFPES